MRKLLTFLLGISLFPISTLAQDYPVNDYCQNAISIDTGSFSTFNFYARTEVNFTCNELYKGIWFIYKSSTDTTMELSVCSDSPPTSVQIFEALTCDNVNNQSLLICKDRACPKDDGPAIFPVTKNQFYYIHVGFLYEYSSLIDIDLNYSNSNSKSAPSNRTCDSAQFISLNETKILNLDHMDISDPNIGNCNIPNDLWYLFVSKKDTSYQITATSLLESGIKTEAFSTNNCDMVGPGNSITCSQKYVYDQEGEHCISWINLHKNDSILIRMGNLFGYKRDSMATLKISESSSPAKNTSCFSALLLIVGENNVYNNYFLNSESYTANCSNGMKNVRWYSFVADKDTTYNLNLCELGYGVAVELFQTNDCSKISQDNLVGCLTKECGFSFVGEKGLNYYFAIGYNSSDSAQIVLNYGENEYANSNLLCENALMLSLKDSTTFTTKNQGNVFPDSVGACYTFYNTWCKFECSETGLYKFYHTSYVGSSTAYPKVEIFEASNCADLNSATSLNLCNPTESYGRSLTNYQFKGRAGLTYFFKLGLSAPTRQDGKIVFHLDSVAEPPTNDICKNAIELRKNEIFKFNREQANIETDVDINCQLQHDIWFTFVADTTNTFIVDACNNQSIAKAYIEVIKANTCEEITKGHSLGCDEGSCPNNNGQIEFQGISGLKYYIHIGSYRQADITNMGMGETLITEKDFTGIIDEFRQPSIQIYPNPAASYINVQLNSLNSNITIYNSIGQIVYQLQNNDYIIPINISALPTGIYHIQVNTKESSFTERLIIQ